MPPGWHAEDAAAAEARGDWFAAAFHLGRSAAYRPEDRSVSERRGSALKRLGLAL
jgi:hypothetical protein